MGHSGLRHCRSGRDLRILPLAVIRRHRETCGFESIGGVPRRGIGLNAKLEVLGGVCTMAQSLRNMARVIEDLSALNSNCHGLLRRSVRILKLRIGIKSPRVCIQRPHILPRRNLLLRKFQRVGRGGGVYRHTSK